MSALLALLPHNHSSQPCRDTYLLYALKVNGTLVTAQAPYSLQLIWMAPTAVDSFYECISSCLFCGIARKGSGDAYLLCSEVQSVDQGSNAACMLTSTSGIWLTVHNDAVVAR